MENIQITPPANHKIVENIINGTKHITFEPIPPINLLPKTWEEYGSMRKHFWFDSEDDCIKQAVDNNNIVKSESKASSLMLPKESQLTAIIALCKLICLRDKYNGDWVADWENDAIKYVIENYNNTVVTETWAMHKRTLAFPNKELRDKFHANFIDLIEEAKEFI